MKRRTDFITNSSSGSYILELYDKQPVTEDELWLNKAIEDCKLTSLGENVHSTPVNVLLCKQRQLNCKRRRKQMRKEAFKIDDPLVPAIEEAVDKILALPFADSIYAIMFRTFNFNRAGYIDKDTSCCMIHLDVDYGRLIRYDKGNDHIEMLIDIDLEIEEKYGLPTGIIVGDLVYDDVLLYKRGD